MTNHPPTSIFIDPETRAQMGAQAVMLAKSVGYSSAGQFFNNNNNNNNYHY